MFVWFLKLHCYVILVLFRDKIDLQLVGSVEEGNGDLSEFQVFHKISEKINLDLKLSAKQKWIYEREIEIKSTYSLKK